MARGHQKFQSQQKNAQKQEKLKKAQGHDQKSAALKALVFTCTVCKVQKMLTFHLFTPKISFLILHSVCSTTILKVMVLRIWHWIN